MAEFIVVHSVKVATEFVPETFGRLTTIGPKFRLPVGTQGLHKFFQVCRCECGNLTVVGVPDLRAEHTRSCGCLFLEQLTDRMTTHGRTHADGYSSWANMIQRCTNPNYDSYHNYGGRGIRVCDRWLEAPGGYANFFKDMGERPSKRHTLERKLVNGDYTPENCKWATIEEQARNRRDNIMLTYKGKTQCRADWEAELGKRRHFIRDRMKRGWTLEQAIETPLGQRNKKS